LTLKRYKPNFWKKKSKRKNINNYLILIHNNIYPLQ